MGDNRHMARTLRLLQIEDSADDGALSALQFRRGGFEVKPRRVQSQEQLAEALNEEWDLVLLDCRLPGFSPERAMELLRKHAEATPVIALTGAVGEERAAHLMRLGCRDLVLKEKMDRLVPAAERELTRKEEIRVLREAHTEAAEHLARSVSNDLDKLLAQIETSAELLGRQPLQPMARAALEEIRDAAFRGRGLTRMLRRFGHAGEHQSLCALDVVVQRVVRMLGSAFGNAGVTLHTDLLEEHSWAQITEQELFRALQALLVNALDISISGEEVRVGVRGHTVFIRHPGEPKAGGTRALVRGEGGSLAQSIVDARALVNARGGHITLGAHEGHTLIQLSLPEASERPKGPTVLLVQAEHGLRRVVGRFLLKEGYTLVEAGNLDDAKAVSPPPDILVADVDLRGESGLELAITLSETLPGLRVCLFANRPEELRPQIEGRAWALLEKPIAPERLTGVLRVLCEGELQVG
ncbi:MAG TPA: response regulator [Myxococcota bacterium]|nr:response regulator [Myxococcota bacterium]